MAPFFIMVEQEVEQVIAMARPYLCLVVVVELDGVVVPLIFSLN